MPLIMEDDDVADSFASRSRMTNGHARPPARLSHWCRAGGLSGRLMTAVEEAAFFAALWPEATTADSSLRTRKYSAYTARARVSVSVQ